MPEEMRKILIARIHTDLKERVNARVHVGITRSTLDLIIDIERDGFYFRYVYSHYHESDFYDYMRAGNDVLIIENEILGIYKSAILRKYFY